MKTNLMKMTYAALFIALIFLLFLTPLGYLKLAGFFEITLIGIPVILGAIQLGPMYGGLLGLVFGLTSFIKAPTDAFFGPFFVEHVPEFILICFLPRILVGVCAGYLNRFIGRFDRSGILASSLSSVVGCLINSAGFLGLAYLLMNGPVAQKIEAMAPAVYGAALASAGITNGIPELVVSTILVTALSKALMVYQKNSKK